MENGNHEDSFKLMSNFSEVGLPRFNESASLYQANVNKKVFGRPKRKSSRLMNRKGLPKRY